VKGREQSEQKDSERGSAEGRNGVIEAEKKAAYESRPPWRIGSLLFALTNKFRL
jgi:hypothetical protein